MNILLFDWNNILTDVAEELVRRGHTLMDNTSHTNLGRWKKADVVVVWNEVELGGWASWIKEVNKFGIRTILVQHGRRGTSRIFPPFNEIPVSKTVCVWSENDKKRLMSCGVPESSLKITGTTIFKHLISRIPPHKSRNVVFSPEHWDGEVIENFIIADELRKLKKVNIITKVLDGEQKEDMYDNVVKSKRNTPEHLRIVAETLSVADVVVAVSESTFELLAESLDIPVVIADIWIPKSAAGDDKYKDYTREYSNACVRSSLNDLNKNIEYALKHPEHLRAERKQICIDDGGIDIEDPLTKICDLIEGK